MCVYLFYGLNVFLLCAILVQVPIKKIMIFGTSLGWVLLLISLNLSCALAGLIFPPMTVVPAVVFLPAPLARCSVTCLGGSSPLKRHFLGSETSLPCAAIPCLLTWATKEHHFSVHWLHQVDPGLFLLLTREVVAEQRTWKASTVAPGQRQHKGNLFFKYECMYL